jgi:hypothetical protein
MLKDKKLSNPFSTGGGGNDFETAVQASFVALMLTSGCVPCLQPWPIVKIKLQGKVDGFATDDLIVLVENPDNNEQRKLIGQIKHSITITKSATLFGDIINSAWNDFNNTKIFTRNRDVIALITYSLNAADQEIIWLTNHARVHNSDTFFRNVSTAIFSSDTKRDKLEVFQHHLKLANKGIELQKHELHDFLRHFYCLCYDLGEEEGVVLSLILSHISQFNRQMPRELWARILEFTSIRDHHAGQITSEDLPEDLIDAFREREIRTIPENFTKSQLNTIDLSKHPDATTLSLAILIGAWDGKNENDINLLAMFFRITYEEWVNKARELLHYPDAPMSLKNGIWELKNRSELWGQLGPRVLDQDLDTFKTIAISVMKESDPALELPSENRWAASMYGKVSKYSSALRKGIAEGLALLGSQPEVCSKCSSGMPEMICATVINETLADADWDIWSSLGSILPTIAEASPSEFLTMLEKTLLQKQQVFEELFAQETGGSTGRSYLPGVLWALEGIAWDEKYFVRACVALGGLASIDPGGSWGNRPHGSLVTILLPWLPQTVAPIDKRKVAVETLLKEYPDVTWTLLLSLLPRLVGGSTLGSYMPKWRKIIPDDWENGVTNHEYWEQVSYYSELLVQNVGTNIERITKLIERFGDLPQTAFNQFIDILNSQSILDLSEDNLFLLWTHLQELTDKHRRFPDAQWALLDEPLTRIEQVTSQLAPKNPFYYYQPLFSRFDYGLLYKNRNDLDEQREKLHLKRETTIKSLYYDIGLEKVIEFAEAVTFPDLVGRALASIEDNIIEKTIFPDFLISEDKKRTVLINTFIGWRFYGKGWEWCDSIDKSAWTPTQIGYFLTCLPYTQDTLKRISLWLDKHQVEYWSRVGVNISFNEFDDGFEIAIEKLLKYGRAFSAIRCLSMMLYNKKAVKDEQCVRALIAVAESKKIEGNESSHDILKLIKYLQSKPTVPKEDLFRVEWTFLPMLYYHSEVRPRLLEGMLANDPHFYCDVIRQLYRSNKESEMKEDKSEESITIATNAWRLLNHWRTTPGTDGNGIFHPDHFTEWLTTIKTLCSESGHLNVALIHIGQVLVKAPADENGLWINQTIAAALNAKDAEEMRIGFSNGLIKSRGTHWVDPSGTPEKELATQFSRKAEDLENAHFQRFAVTLRELASDYEHQAIRVQQDYDN